MTKQQQIEQAAREVEIEMFNAVELLHRHHRGSNVLLQIGDCPHTICVNASTVSRNLRAALAAPEPQADETPATLTPEQAQDYTLIVNKDHPEWGTWRMNRDRNGWVIKNDRGSKMLDEQEFHYWTVVHVPPAGMYK